MDKVRAKFQCESITDQPACGNKNVVLRAATDGSEENRSFSKYTPSGQLNIVISYETEASNFFEAGKEYYLDFTAAPE